ncbi:hypothetical protein FNV43_RR02492 [Rhamnella rubrinervis]|uniref:Uncharacterized protein n=1 Tax=Rhamnella rubrinervis TaxID=2594499 RepID=A0A8K0HRJ5_9ROSA|nr:hypothetical protein FNV43_RR02492 [Rhamnella rubrinervis]
MVAEHLRIYVLINCPNSLKEKDINIAEGLEKFEEYEDVSPPSVAKIPKSYVPSVAMPTMFVPEGAEKKDEKFDEDNQQNIRASSIPRPRSSPDNDLAIGNKNRIKTESRASILKNRNSGQNRHAQSQCKVFSSHSVENSMNTQKSKEATDESNLKGRKGSGVTVPSQRRQPRTGKPSSMRT